MNDDTAKLIDRARKLLDKASDLDTDTPADMTARQLLAAAKLFGAMTELLADMTDQLESTADELDESEAERERLADEIDGETEPTTNAA